MGHNDKKLEGSRRVVAKYCTVFLDLTEISLYTLRIPLLCGINLIVSIIGVRLVVRFAEVV